jgi:predicted O-methyltransferase YrrM
MKILLESPRCGKCKHREELPAPQRRFLKAALDGRRPPPPENAAAGRPAIIDARTHTTPIVEIPSHVFARLFGDGYAPPSPEYENGIPTDRRAILALARTLKPRRVLEIGVRFGSTAHLLLRECPWIEEYWGVDCPPSHEMGNAIQQRENPGDEAGALVDDARFKLHVLPRGSLDLDRRTCGRFDLIFIDGDHSLRGVWHDTQLAREIVAPAGAILWNDYYSGDEVNSPERAACATREVVTFMNRRECGHILRVEGTCLCMELHRGGTLLRPQTTDIVIPDSPKQFNSALMDCDRGYLFCMRRTRPVGGHLAFAFLDKDLRVASDTLCADALVGEDPRLCHAGGRHYAIFSTGMIGEDATTHRCMAIAELAVDYPRTVKVRSWARLRFDGSDRTGEQPGGYPHMEKNWLSFAHKGRLLFAYQMNPHVICELAGELDGMSGGYLPVRELGRTQTDRWPLGLIVHGGAPPVFLPRARAYLGIMHAGWRHANNAQEFRWNPEHFDCAQGAYSAGAYLMEPRPPFRITHSSVEPVIFGELFPETGYTHDYPESLGTIFPTGLILRGDEALVIYGENDQKTRVARMPVQALLDTLVPLPDKETP